jgi:hypothetical protein
MLQLAPRGEIAVPILKLEAPPRAACQETHKAVRRLTDKRLCSDRVWAPPHPQHVW